MVWRRVVTTRVDALSSMAVRGLLAFSALSLALAAAPRDAAAQPPGDDDAAVSQGPVVVYLVRHAEKASDGTDDPPLSLAGKIRVMGLRQLLSEAALTHIHTTDFNRTRDTARPIAEEHGVDAAVYDPRELRMLADGIRRTPGSHLVVGHSNTTPVLVAALGGDPFDPIDEYEYDRLYIVVAHPGQPPTTILLRFGEPYIEGFDIGLRAERTEFGPPVSRRPNGPGQQSLRR